MTSSPRTLAAPHAGTIVPLCGTELLYIQLQRFCVGSVLLGQRRGPIFQIHMSEAI